MTRVSIFPFSVLPVLTLALVPGSAVAQSQPYSVTPHVTPHSKLQPISYSKSDPADGFTGSGSPDRRSSGGSRGSCDDLLVALVPGDRALAVSEAGCNLPSGSTLALTATDTPVFWFHVPAQAAPVTGEFALLDENQIALAVETVSLPQQAGIVGIQVDASLDVDRTYRWVFSLLAHPRNPSENPRVSGRLSRITTAPNLLTELDSVENERDRALLWIDEGIWHDALTAVANLRQTESAMAEQDWQDFLGSAGLGAIADAPIQDCCL